MISVIIPTYNEKDNLNELFSRIERSLNGLSHEIIIVDDKSPDETADKVKELSSSYPVKVIVRPKKLGLSSAVMDGLSIARGNVIAVMDADLQHPPEVLPTLYEKIEEGCDIVIASRYIKGGSVENWSLIRKLISKGSIVLAWILLPQVRWIKDPVSGYFMFRRQVIRDCRLNPRGFKILMEILVKGNYSRVCETPYTFGLRRRGISKLGASTIISYVLHILDLSSPIVRFALVGAFGTLVNLGVLWILRYALGIFHEIASALAIEISVLSNFSLNDLWTFRRKRKVSVIESIIRYHLANASGILVQYATSVALFKVIGLESLTSQFIGIIFGFLFNYALSRKIVWW